MKQESYQGKVVHMRRDKRVDLVYRHIVLELHGLQNTVTALQNVEFRLEDLTIFYGGPAPPFLHNLRHSHARPLQEADLARFSKML